MRLTVNQHEHPWGAERTVTMDMEKEKLTDYIQSPHFSTSEQYDRLNMIWARSYIGEKIGWDSFANDIMLALSTEKQEEILCWICKNWDIEYHVGASKKEVEQ